MKNQIATLLLFFAAFIMANGLKAQTPRPVHGTETNQEAQTQDDNSIDRTYNHKEIKKKDRRLNKGERGRKGNAEQAKCIGDENDNTSYKAEKRNERNRKGLDKEDFKHTMRARKGQMKKEQKSFKKHPIFERRADARNGKGEKY